MTKPLALIIDDEPDILELLSMTLEQMDIDFHTADTVAKGKVLLNQHTFDFCLTDMKLPDGNGFELISLLQEQKKSTPIAVITAHGNVNTAIEAMKLGAFDFLSKPIELNNLRNLISSAIQAHHTKKTSYKIQNRQLIGNSPQIKSLKQTILKVANSQAPVYIIGESGTGKEMVAQLIHKNSSRNKQAFIAINCGAIPSELMESEFFGHKKGSFTGATQDKAGLFQAANGGTLFLDEIADLPLSMQVKLLRAIQERSIRPVGSESELSVDVRIISASHKHLNTLVDQGKFRQDLFYRINVIEVNVPALREHTEDIPLLIKYFLERLSNRNNIELPKIKKSAVEKLMSYSFPGNIRELENILERALALCNENTIYDIDLKLSQTTSTTTDNTKNSQPHDAARGSEPLEKYLENIEKELLLNALEKFNGNKTAAAEYLGISFRAIRYRLKKLNID